MQAAELHVAHTADLPRELLDATRGFLHDVFEGDFDGHDWEHALGGVHAHVLDGGELIAHGSVVMRRLVHGGRALRTGYVEGVGVRADRRREGHGQTVMQALGRVIRGAYEVGALGATDEAIPLYERLGWRRWEGPTSALTPEGTVRTADDDGGVFVLRHTAELDLTAPLTCDWRDGDCW